MSKFSKKFWVVLAIVIAIVLGIMAAATVIGHGNMAVGGVVGTVIAPIQKGVTVASDAVDSFFSGFGEAKRLRNENEELRLQILQLQQETRNLDTYQNENARLRAMLEMKEAQTAQEYVGARVIAKDTGDWYYTFVIDKGSSDGIAPSAVVVTPQGLVGTVTEVSATWSKVKTVLDVESSVGAMCGRTNDMGILEGSVEHSRDNCTLMRYIDKNAKLVVGDSVETSGIGGVYPRGLLIGKVTAIEDQIEGLSLVAVVESSVNFNTVSEVLVSK